MFSETIQLTATIKCNHIPQNIYEYERISKNEGTIDIVFKYPFKGSKHISFDTTMELFVSGYSLVELKYCNIGNNKFSYIALTNEGQKID